LPDTPLGGHRRALVVPCGSELPSAPCSLGIPSTCAGVAIMTRRWTISSARWWLKTQPAATPTAQARH